MRHYYRVPEKSQVGKNIFHLLHDCEKTKKSTIQYLKRMGAIDYYQDSHVFEGGVSFLMFEDRDKVDENVWRYVSDINGEACFEPNCQNIISAAVLVNEDFRPSNTANIIYERHSRRFEEVCLLCPWKHWAQIAHYKMRGSEYLKEDIAYLQKFFEGTRFIKYMSITPSGSGHTGKKMTKAEKMAVEAERLRFKLPVIDMTRVFKTLCADMTEAKKQQLEFTPRFFPSGGYYYISMQFASTDESMERINEAAFIVGKNQYLQENK